MAVGADVTSAPSPGIALRPGRKSVHDDIDPGRPALVAAHDVFLSHDSRDKAAVERLAQKLIEAGVSVFFDKWNLIPGDPWQEALERSRTVAVFVGAREIAP